MSNDKHTDLDSGQKKPKFYKVYPKYLHDVNHVMGVPGRIIQYTMREMNDNTGKVYAEHREIAEDIGASTSHVSRILREFERCHLIVMGRGNYMVNPRAICYGDDGKQDRNIRTYDKWRNSKNIKNEMLNHAQKEEIW